MTLRAKTAKPQQKGNEKAKSMKSRMKRKVWREEIPREGPGRNADATTENNKEKRERAGNRERRRMTINRPYGKMRKLIGKEHGGRYTQGKRGEEGAVTAKERESMGAEAKGLRRTRTLRERKSRSTETQKEREKRRAQ